MDATKSKRLIDERGNTFCEECWGGRSSGATRAEDIDDGMPDLTALYELGEAEVPVPMPHVATQPASSIPTEKCSAPTAWSDTKIIAAVCVSGAATLLLALGIFAYTRSLDRRNEAHLLALKNDGDAALSNADWSNASAKYVEATRFAEQHQLSSGSLKSEVEECQRGNEKASGKLAELTAADQAAEQMRLEDQQRQLNAKKLIEARAEQQRLSEKKRKNEFAQAEKERRRGDADAERKKRAAVVEDERQQLAEREHQEQARAAVALHDAEIHRQEEPVDVLCYSCGGTGRKSDQELMYDRSAVSAEYAGVPGVRQIKIDPTCPVCRGTGTLKSTRGKVEDEQRLPERVRADAVCDGLFKRGVLRDAQFVGYFAGLQKFRAVPGRAEFGIRYKFTFITQNGLVRVNDFGYVIMRNGKPVVINIDGEDATINVSD